MLTDALALERLNQYIDFQKAIYVDLHLRHTKASKQAEGLFQMMIIIQEQSTHYIVSRIEANKLQWTRFNVSMLGLEESCLCIYEAATVLGKRDQDTMTTLWIH